MQTSSNVAYMPDLYEMKIPLKKSQCAMFRAGNVYPARCRQPGVGAGTTDQWEQVAGRRAGAGGATAHSPDTRRCGGGSLPSHRGLDETTFLDNCTALYCTVLVAVCCVLVLTGTVPWWGGGWRLGEVGQSRQGEQPSGCQKKEPRLGTCSLAKIANDLSSSYHACILH